MEFCFEYWKKSFPKCVCNDYPLLFVLLCLLSLSFVSIGKQLILAKSPNRVCKHVGNSVSPLSEYQVICL